MKNARDTLSEIMNLFNRYRAYEVGQRGDYAIDPAMMSPEDFNDCMSNILCNHSGHIEIVGYNRCIRCGKDQAEVSPADYEVEHESNMVSLDTFPCESSQMEVKE